MQQVQLNNHDDYEDYDPFGHIDADGNDVSIATEMDSPGPTTNANHGDASTSGKVTKVEQKVCETIDPTTKQEVNQEDKKIPTH